MSITTTTTIASTTTTTTVAPNALRKHLLSLEVTPTNNSRVFRIADTSNYSNLLQVVGGELKITSPGFNVPQKIDVLPGFNLVLNSCTLGIQHEGCASSSYPLPDGIYVIHYSVSPNLAVYVEYNHLRVTQTLNKYFNELCKLEMAACEPTADIMAQLKELRLIKDFIDAAIAKVEYCNDPEKGMELLLYAQQQLNKYANKYC
jgi:hypothetical protein